MPYPLACAAPPTRTSSGVCGARTGRCGRRRGRRRSPTGSGWLDIAERSREQLADLEGLRDELVAEGYTDAIVLGMGGSSLAPEVFRQSFGPQDGGLRLHVLDSTHPDEVRKFLDGLDLDKSLMIVSSKSGGTIEPMSMYKAFHARVDGTHFVAVTDPGTSLEKLAGAEGFRRVVLRRPRDRRPLQRAERVRARPGRGRRLQRRRHPRLRDRRRRGVPRRAGQRRAVARLRARRTRAPGPRQADDRRRRPAQLLWRVGRATRRRVDRQAGPRHPADRRRAARRRLRRRPRVPAHRARRSRQRREAGRHRTRPATR